MICPLLKTENPVFFCPLIHQVLYARRWGLSELKKGTCPKVSVPLATVSGPWAGGQSVRVWCSGSPGFVVRPGRGRSRCPRGLAGSVPFAGMEMALRGREAKHLFPSLFPFPSAHPPARELHGAPELLPQPREPAQMLRGRTCVHTRSESWDVSLGSCFHGGGCDPNFPS